MKWYALNHRTALVWPGLIDGIRIIVLLGQYLQVARYSLNNSSIHNASACTSMCRHIYDWNIVNCDVKQQTQLNSTQCITLYTDPHHSFISSILGIQHFSLVSFTWQVTPRQPRYKYSFQLLTTARVAQLVERWAAVLEDPGSNPTNTQVFLLLFFFSLISASCTI